MGRGGGQVVSMFVFYSDDPNSNPTEVLLCKLFENNENKQKETFLKMKY